MSDLQPYDPGPPAPVRQSWPVAQPSWQAPAVLTDRRDVGAAVLVIAWVVAVLTLGYMLPWAIAASRGRSNHGAVAILNLFLGWSLIGWVVALVMACSAHQVVGPGVQTTVIVAQQFSQAHITGPVPAPQLGPGPGWYQSPDAPGQQYWDGSAWTEHRAP